MSSPDVEQWTWMRYNEHEHWLKLGGREKRKIGDETYHLYWDVWRPEEEERARTTPRARFCIERSHVSGRRISKEAYDDYAEALKTWGGLEREYAIHLAKQAFNLKP